MDGPKNHENFEETNLKDYWVKEEYRRKFCIQFEFWVVWLYKNHHLEEDPINIITY